MLLAWASLAWALDAREAWIASHDALLHEALDGSLSTARARYEDLLQTHIPAGDPSLALVTWRLGQVAWAQGDTARAREALDACIRAGVEKGRCLDLRARIDLDVDAVHEVPVLWDFQDAHHGFLHPRAYWDQGSIRIIADADQSVLAWQTTIDGSREDELIVGFRDPRPAPKVIRLRITSTRLEAAVALMFEDIEGNRFVPPQTQYRVAVGAPTDIVVRIADLSPLDADGPRPDGARLHRMVLSDLTSLLGITGENELHIDWFEVR